MAGKPSRRHKTNYCSCACSQSSLDERTVFKLALDVSINFCKGTVYARNVFVCPLYLYWSDSCDGTSVKANGLILPPADFSDDATLTYRQYHSLSAQFALSPTAVNGTGSLDRDFLKNVCKQGVTMLCLSSGQVYVCVDCIIIACALRCRLVDLVCTCTV